MAKNQNALENRKHKVIALAAAGLNCSEIASVLAAPIPAKTKPIAGVSVDRRAVTAFLRRHREEVDDAKAEAGRRAMEIGITAKAERMRRYEEIDAVLAHCMKGLLDGIPDGKGAVVYLNPEMVRAVQLAAATRFKGLHNVAEETGELMRRSDFVPAELTPSAPTAGPFSETTLERVIVRRYEGLDLDNLG